MTFLTGALIVLVTWFLADALIVTLLLTNQTLRRRVIYALEQIENKNYVKNFIERAEEEADEYEEELTDPIAKEVAECDLCCDSCGYEKKGLLSEIGNRCEHCNEGFMSSDGLHCDKH